MVKLPFPVSTADRRIRVGLRAVLVQDAYVQLVRPPVAIGLQSRGGSGTVLGEGAAAFVAHDMVPLDRVPANHSELSLSSRHPGCH